MRNLSLILSLLLLAACQPKSPQAAESGPPAAAALPLPAQLDLRWRFDTRLDSFENPQTEVSLIVNGAAFAVGPAQAIDTLARADYGTYQIPATALTAAGGWWAGGGTYYYVGRNDTALRVYRGYADEGMEEKDLYQYEEIMQIGARDLP
jgi:hypothetical protein